MSDNKREAEDSKNDSPNAKRARQNEEILDLAATLGFRDGDRLEVAWQVNDEEESHWWGATLLPWNGKDIVDDCVAVRHLKYDPYPAGGFDETSVEPVVFLGENLLAHPETHEELNFRREGEEEESSEEGSPVRADPSELVEQTLQNVLAKHGGLLAQLPPSQQAVIAEQVAKKREQLVAHLEAATSSGVVTKSRMQDILSSVWKGETAESSSK